MRSGVDNHIKSDAKSQIAVPSRFKKSAQQQRGRANRALRPGGPADLLFGALPDPHLYNLKHYHLGIDVSLAHKALIYERSVLDFWLNRVSEEVKSPFFYKFEVGAESFKELLHVHLIADGNAGLLDVSREGEVIKAFRPGTEKVLMSYLYKPPVPFSLSALEDFEKASLKLGRQGKALPKVSGYVLS